MWSVLLSLSAHAYESDQLTGRGLALEPADSIADDAMNAVMATAIAATNRAEMCSGDIDATHRRLAREIFRASAGSDLPERRGGARSLGYGFVQTDIETHPDLDRRTFVERTDIYSGVPWHRSLALRFAGTCSTIHLAGVDIGTDKIDHFVGEGFAYWSKSKHGKDPERAIRWGEFTERTVFGLMSSQTLSYADLSANFDGYRFYSTLFGEDSLVELSPDGCVRQTRPFSWQDWVRPDWDEVWNPSRYTNGVRRAIGDHLQAHRDAVCSEYAIWADEAYHRQLESLGAPRDYVLRPTSDRQDPFELAALCSGS